MSNTERELRQELERLIQSNHSESSGGVVAATVDMLMPLIQRHCALMVAAAYQDAVQYLRERGDQFTFDGQWKHPDQKVLAEEIEKRTPVDVQKWLEAHDVDMREKRDGDWTTAIEKVLGISCGVVIGPGEVHEDIENFLLTHDEEVAAVAKRVELERICAGICPHCAGRTPYTELHDGKYHTEKGVSPTWKNKLCSAAAIRAADEGTADDATLKEDQERKCPKCGAALRYCPQGKYCSNQDCGYAC